MLTTLKEKALLKNPSLNPRLCIQLSFGGQSVSALVLILKVPWLIIISGKDLPWHRDRERAPRGLS